MKQAGTALHQDILWAGYLLLLGVLFGLLYQWPLVKTAWQGDLNAFLDKMAEQRRAAEFKGIPVVKLEEAHELWQKGDTLFVDVRSPEEFAELHVAGAVNLPEEKLENLKDMQDSGFWGIPRNRRILVYCSTVRCNSSLKAARRLQNLGFTEVMAFLGGFQAWDEAGYEVDSSR